LIFHVVMGITVHQRNHKGRFRNAEQTG
jgi:hypothetical protein